MNKVSLALKAASGAIGVASLPEEQRQVTFYSEGKNYWPHLEGLLQNVLETTEVSVCYLSSSLDDPGLKIRHERLNSFYIGMGFVRDYIFQSISTELMIMTMPNLNTFQVKRSKHDVHYVYVQHSLVSLHMIYRHGAFDHFDTICCAGNHHVAEIRALEEKYNLPPKKIVELGYSRLDNLIETARSRSRPQATVGDQSKSILLAPSWGETGLIEIGAGKKLVNDLLGLGHKVIFRPHPQTAFLSPKRVAEITNAHKDNQLFVYESHVAGQDSFHDSEIMISDWSGAALEYALALKKPVVFCDIPRKVNNPGYQEIAIEPIEVAIRDKIGVVWDTESPIEEAISKCERMNRSEFDTLCRSNVFNIGHSDECFGDFVRSFKC